MSSNHVRTMKALEPLANHVPAHGEAGRTSIPRGSAPKTNSDPCEIAGDHSLSSDSDSDDGVARKVKGNVHFQPRTLPVKKFDRGGFVVYIVFLVTFLVSHAGDHSSDQYYFAAAVKNWFGASEFQTISSSGQYFEWLALHFLPCMAALSVGNTRDSAYAIVGAPRIKQLRSANCTTPAHMAHVVPNCYSDEDDRNSFGGADGKAFVWSDSDELLHWSAELGEFYSSAGFVVPRQIIQNFLAEPSWTTSHGTEMYQFQHEKMDISALEGAGWWDARTRVIFHDFTVYSSAMDAFMVVRLTCEAGARHGDLIVSRDMWYLELRELVGVVQLAEYALYVMLALLIAYELHNFARCYLNPGQLMTEHIIQLRYQLKYKKLHHGAFLKVCVYEPQRVLNRLTKRLFVKYRQDKMKDKGHASVNMVDLSRDHINFLNNIGQSIVSLHQTYLRMVANGFTADFTLASVVENKDDDAQYQASLAVIDMFDHVQKLHKAKADLEAIQRIEGSNIMVSRFSLSQFRIRIGYAFRGYFRDRWNMLDVVNYSLFVVTVVLRMKTMGQMAALKTSIEQLSVAPGGLWSEYIDFRSIAYLNDQQYHLSSLNAILTCLKVFRYLDHKPEIRILQRTLYKASAPLGWLLLSFVIVLLGSAQGFNMAFGLDIAAYRSTYASVFSLLRMAVGDFDYDELETSQRILGPAFFVYYVLAFLVLVSIFIALISEAYDAARDERAHMPAPRMKRRGYGNLWNVTREADKRVDMAKHLGLISDGLYRELAPFVNALSSFKLRADVLEDASNLQKSSTSRAQLQIGTHGSLFGGIPEAVDHKRTQITQKIAPPRSKMGDWINHKRLSRLKWEADQFKARSDRSHGSRFRALETIHGTGPNELSFRRNDIIIVTNRPEFGRWRGFRYEDGPAVSGEFDAVCVSNELKNRHDGLDASSSDDDAETMDMASVATMSTVESKIANRRHQRRGDTDFTFDDPIELEHDSKDRRPLSQHDAKQLGENASLGRGRALKFATELKTSAETSVISHKVGREADPTRASPAKKRSAVMLEMDTSAVSQRRYTPSASTSQDATSLTMHEGDKSVAPTYVHESENCSRNDQADVSGGFTTVTNESWQVDAVKQKLSALALSVVPDLQEILQLNRAQQIEAQQATRAQLALAEEVQQLRHELRVLSAAFDRRVPEPPQPGAGWTRMTHGAFRSPDFPHGREYWQHEDGTTSWERPAGVPTPVEEMQNRKLLGAGSSEKRTNMPGEVNEYT